MAAPFLHYIDEPVIWTRLPRCLIIRGWCLAESGAPLQAIRLKTGDVTVPGLYGLPRPDVRTAVPTAQHDNTGFEIRVMLPSGRGQLSIEAQTTDAAWISIFTTETFIHESRLPRWLGGSDARELLAFQMPAHMAHAPRPLIEEKFPHPRAIAARPCFSIVTPSYQQGPYLEETMCSVLSQPGITCQYVVQDGGSTDGSADLIRQKAGALHAWASHPDGGQANAIKQGFTKTTGKPTDLMAWLNSDDFYLPGTLAYVADYFAKHPDVDVLYGHRILVDEHSQEIGRWFLPAHDAEVLRLNDFVPQETLFWRRHLWDKIGGIDPTYKFAMDWDLLLRFQAAGARIVRVPYFLACFRIHALQKTSAAMHTNGQKEIDHLRQRTHGRSLSPEELEQHPRLQRYLRKSALLEFLWRRLGLRLP